MLSRASKMSARQSRAAPTQRRSGLTAFNALQMRTAKNGNTVPANDANSFL